MELENQPLYINNAFSKGFEVEVEVEVEIDACLRLHNWFYDVCNKDFEKIFNKNSFLDSCKVLK